MSSGAPRRGRSPDPGGDHTPDRVVFGRPECENGLQPLRAQRDLAAAQQKLAASTRKAPNTRHRRSMVDLVVERTERMQPGDTDRRRSLRGELQRTKGSAIGSQDGEAVAAPSPFDANWPENGRSGQARRHGERTRTADEGDAVRIAPGAQPRPRSDR